MAVFLHRQESPSTRLRFKKLCNVSAFFKATKSSTSTFYKELGGNVFEGVWCGKPVAIKRIQLSSISSKDYVWEEVLLKLDHPNVIKLLHVENVNPTFRQYYFELCNASLDRLFLRDEDVRKYRGAMPPTFDVLNQLAKGLEFIHSSKLFHCDIKPQNVLIRVNPKNEEASIKWADFGLSKRAQEKRTCTTSEVTGTCREWLAPELFKFPDNSQTVKSEVFAEGLVFSYYLMDGQHPLVVTLENLTISIDRTDTLTNQNKIQPQYARDLIKKMLADQPEERITSSDVTQELARQAKLQTELIDLCSGEIYPSVDSIENLIGKGVDVNCVDRNGLTPLLHLVQSKSSGGNNLVELIQFLIENGTNLNCKDNDGSDVLHRRNALQLLAKNYKKENVIQIAQVLIHSGIEINPKDDHHENALHEVMRSSMDKNLKSKMIRLLIRHGIKVHPEWMSQSEYKMMLNEIGNYGKEMLEFLAERKICLGWHDECLNCKEILSIEEPYMGRTQHHRKFFNILSGFRLTLEDLGKCPQLKAESGIFEMTSEESIKWLRNLAEEYDDVDTKNCFLVMVEICEQMKHGIDSSCFNCNNYEHYLRVMCQMADFIGCKETKEQIEWCYLLPFDFPLSSDPIGRTESQEVKIKREWDNILINWAHEETEKHYGDSLKEDAEDGLFLPEKYVHKCHKHHLHPDYSPELRNTSLSFKKFFFN